MYSSPAHRGAKVIWTTPGHSLDLLCLDERDIVIARFSFNESSPHKGGKLVITGTTAMDKRVLEEEIVVTALAMAECVLHIL